MANIWYIQVNRFCNNKCHFCSNPSTWGNISFKRGIELIDSFIEKKYYGIIFTWWEPTLSSHLPKWIKYSVEKWIHCRVISNWMKCSDSIYFKSLKKAGLSLIHFSLYSCSEKIHDFLTDTPWSYNKLIKAIENSIELWIDTQLNSVINKFNENHLDKTILFVVKKFPQIRHFVWNNLDPEMMRKTEIAKKTLPNYDIFAKSLKKSLQILQSAWKTFRVERVPLCYLEWFEWTSTETRKIVKDEERIVHFLDSREIIKQDWKNWEHEKLSWCKECDLNSICAWIYKYKNFFTYVKVYPKKFSKEQKENIINKIKN